MRERRHASGRSSWGTSRGVGVVFLLVVACPTGLGQAQDDPDNRWTVPMGAGVGEIVRLGKLSLGASADAFDNVTRPDHAFSSCSRGDPGGRP
jgi:hypothetical protein